MIVRVSLYDFFFYRQKTAYEMRISDWSSDVCSSDLVVKRAAECHPDRLQDGRGLCDPCYARARRAGTLADHPRQTRSRAEFLDEYETTGRAVGRERGWQDG